MVFFVDHRSRLPLLSATAPTASLALSMAFVILLAIQPRYCWRLNLVIVHVDERLTDADARKPNRDQ